MSLSTIARYVIFCGSGRNIFRRLSTDSNLSSYVSETCSRPRRLLHLQRPHADANRHFADRVGGSEPGLSAADAAETEGPSGHPSPTAEAAMTAPLCPGTAGRASVCPRSTRPARPSVPARRGRLRVRPSTLT